MALEHDSDTPLAKTTLSDLHDDILLELITWLGILDLISLRMVNKRFNNFTMLRSAWHRMLLILHPQIHIPTRIPVRPDLDAADLEQIVTAAWQLHVNLESPFPQAQSLSRHVSESRTSYLCIYPIPNSPFLATIHCRGLVLFVLRIWDASEDRLRLLVECNFSTLPSQPTILGAEAVYNSGNFWEVFIATKDSRNKVFPYVCKISYGLGHIRQVFDESTKFGVGWDATTTPGSMPPFSADQRVFAVAFAPMFIALRNWSTGASSSINLAHDKVNFEDWPYEGAAIRQVQVIGQLRMLIVGTTDKEVLYNLPEELFDKDGGEDRDTPGPLTSTLLRVFADPEELVGSTAIFYSTQVFHGFPDCLVLTSTRLRRDETDGNSGSEDSDDSDHSVPDQPFEVYRFTLTKDAPYLKARSKLRNWRIGELDLVELDGLAKQLTDYPQWTSFHAHPHCVMWSCGEDIDDYIDLRDEVRQRNAMFLPFSPHVNFKSRYHKPKPLLSRANFEGLDTDISSMIQADACVAFDRSRGRLFVASEGELAVVSYAPAAWIDEDE